jgi:hypothetical protein
MIRLKFEPAAFDTGALQVIISNLPIRVNGKAAPKRAFSQRPTQAGKSGPRF